MSSSCVATVVGSGVIPEIADDNAKTISKARKRGIIEHKNRKPNEYGTNVREANRKLTIVKTENTEDEKIFGNITLAMEG